MLFRYYILILVFILFCRIDIYSQTKEDLERKRIEAQEIIRNTSRLLEETSVTRQNSLEKLNIVNRRLQTRQSLINTIESEVEYIDFVINQRNERISELEGELNDARDAYSRLIKIAHKHRFTHQKVMFILSAENFNQAYRRFKYLQQYSQSRQKQIIKIRELTSNIVEEIDKLEINRNEKIILLQQQQNETNLLSRERREQNSIIKDLQRREGQLREKIKEQEKIAQALQNAIEDLIREEARIAREAEIYELTPEEKIVSDQFQNNKGGLPWPIDRGVVTGQFGENPHPVLQGIKIQNNGIDISTVENSEVKALFRGVVRQILTVPGLNNVVIIRHGNFLTVYANLSHVYVRSGDKIETSQLIGRVFTDSEEPDKTVLHLEIWDENRKLDPVLWLSRQ